MSNDRPGGDLPPLKLRSKRRLLPELELDLRRPRRGAPAGEAEAESPTPPPIPPAPEPDLEEPAEEPVDEPIEDAIEDAIEEPIEDAAADDVVADEAVAEPDDVETAAPAPPVLSPIQRLATPLTERPTFIVESGPPHADDPAEHALDDSDGDGFSPVAVEDAAADEDAEAPASEDVLEFVPAVIADPPPPPPPPLPPPLPEPAPQVAPLPPPVLVAPPVAVDVLPPASRRERRAAEKASKPPKAEKPAKPPKPPKAEKPAKPSKPPKAEKPAKPSKPPKAEKPAKPSKALKAAKPAKPAKPAAGPRVRKAPLYWRVLRLRHVQPSGWQRAVLLEGVIGAAVILVLAGKASLWTLIVLPVVAALLVKLHDVLMGSLAGPHAGPSTPEPTAAVNDSDDAPKKAKRAKKRRRKRS